MTTPVDQTALAAFNGDPAPGLAASPPPQLPPVEGADPEAPFGRKADGTPRRSRPGPGRGNRRDPADEPRTTDKPPAPEGTRAAGSQSPAPERDYAAQLDEAGMAIWIGLSSIPWTQGHAALWRAQYPALAAGLAQGAKSNAGVRRWVEKYSGDGSVTWVIPVSAAVASLALGSWELIKNTELRQQLAKVNEAEFKQFVMEQAQAMGLPTLVPSSATESSSSPPPAQAA